MSDETGEPDSRLDPNCNDRVPRDSDCEAKSAAQSSQLNVHLRELLSRVRQGDNAAAGELLSIIDPQIIRVVRRRMNPRLRERFDSQDFTQAVWASFLANLPDTATVCEGVNIVPFLRRMATNKVISAGRRLQLNVEQRDHASRAMSGTEQPDPAEATPSQYAVANETMDRLLKDEDEFDRRIIELRRQGMSQKDIAETLKISERQIRRVMLRLSRKLSDDSTK